MPHYGTSHILGKKIEVWFLWQRQGLLHGYQSFTVGAAMLFRCQDFNPAKSMRNSDLENKK